MRSGKENMTSTDYDNYSGRPLWDAVLTSG